MDKQEQEQRDETIQLHKWERLNRRRVFQRRMEPDPSRANLFASLHGKLTSADICESFVDCGLTADAFAGQLAELLADKKTSTHAKIRLMTLASRILAQSEGQLVTVNSSTDLEKKEIEAEVVILEKQLLEAAGGQRQLTDETAGGTEGGTHETEQGSVGELHPASEGENLA